MNTGTAKIVMNIEARIAELSKDVLVETNSGTYGDREAIRKVGNADKQFSEYRIVETIDGQRTTYGCDPTEAPGYARKIAVPSAAERRAKITQLKIIAEQMRDWPSYQPLPSAVQEFLC